MANQDYYQEGYYQQDPSGAQPTPPPFEPEKQKMFSNIFSFKGRIRRLEYGLTYIAIYALSVVVGFVVGIISGIYGVDESSATLLVYIAMLPLLYVQWAQGAKRCHDRGNSGWYQIIPFYIFVMFFGDGESGENEYGSNPKGE